jgi:hypothetical protein
VNVPVKCRLLKAPVPLMTVNGPAPESPTPVASKRSTNVPERPATVQTRVSTPLTFNVPSGCKTTVPTSLIVPTMVPAITPVMVSVTNVLPSARRIDGAPTKAVAAKVPPPTAGAVAHKVYASRADADRIVFNAA